MHNLVLLPTYNEKDTIALTLEQIFSLYPDIHVLVIDDSSPDGTAEIVQDLVATYSNLRLMQRKNKTGLGDAYKDALSQLAADTDIKNIVTMDADGSHEPKYIRAMLECLDDVGLAIGSRYIAQGGTHDWELWRRYLSKFGNWYAQQLTGIKVKDLTAGFIAVRHALVKNIDFSQLSAAGYAYQIEFKYHCIKRLKADFVEIPIIFESRRGGESKLSRQIVREGVIAPLKIFIKRLFG